MFRRTLFFALWLTLAPSVQAAEYFVSTSGNDGNPGTSNAPWRSVSVGIQRLQAGDTMTIRGGTYNENIDSNWMKIPRGTSWDKAVTVRAAQGERVVFTKGMNLVGPANHFLIFHNIFWHGGEGVGLNNVNYVAIHGGEVTGMDKSGIITVAGSQHNQFTNIKVYRNGGKHAGQAFYDHGIYVSTQNNLVHGCEIFENSGAGIQLYDGTSANTNGNVIQNNTIYNSGLQSGLPGIVVYHCDGCLVANNILENNFIGMAVEKSRNVRFYNNTIYFSKQWGLQVGANTVGTKVVNNIVHRVGHDYFESVGQGTIARGNRFGDPKFVDDTKHNFALRADSDALDTGDDVPDLAEDCTGKPRKQGRAVDPGAFEFAGDVVAVPTAPRPPVNLRVSVR